MVIPSFADILNASDLVPSERWEQGKDKWRCNFVHKESRFAPYKFCAVLELLKGAGEHCQGERVYIAIAPLMTPKKVEFLTGERDPDDGCPLTEYRFAEYTVTLVVGGEQYSNSERAFKGKVRKCYNDLAFIGEKVKEAYDEYVAFQQSVTLD